MSRAESRVGKDVDVTPSEAMQMILQGSRRLKGVSISIKHGSPCSAEVTREFQGSDEAALTQ